MDRAFSKCVPPAWLKSVGKEEGQSFEWFNQFMERYFADMIQSQTYYFRTMKTLSEKLAITLETRKPSWLTSVNLKELDIGNAAININFVNFRAGNQPKEQFIIADVLYKGGLKISFGAILLGKIPAEVKCKKFEIF